MSPGLWLQLGQRVAWPTVKMAPNGQAAYLLELSVLQYPSRCIGVRALLGACLIPLFPYLREHSVKLRLRSTSQALNLPSLGDYKLVVCRISGAAECPFFPVHSRPDTLRPLMCLWRLRLRSTSQALNLPSLGDYKLVVCRISGAAECPFFPVHSRPDTLRPLMCLGE